MRFEFTSVIKLVRRSLAVIVAVALAAGCSGGAKDAVPTTGGPAPSAAPATTQAVTPTPTPPANEAVNDRLRREIATSGLTVDRARQLFVLEVTALPGVAAPQGQVNPTYSGSFALTQLMAVRDQLTVEQRARLDQLTDFGRSVFPANLPPVDKPALPAPFTPSIVRPIAYQPSAEISGVVPALFIPDNTEQAYRDSFLELYHYANDAISALTGRSKIGGFQLAFEDLSGTDWALTTAWRNDEKVQFTQNGQTLDGCGSRIDVRKFAGNPINVYLSVVVHEVFHCYQQVAASSANQVHFTAGWLQDGEATWAQMVIVPGAAFEALRTHWNEYMANPKGHLFERKYDAAGFFGHVADIAGDATVGSRLIPAFVAGGFGKNESAYNTIVAGKEDKVLDTWAPSYFRAHEAKDLWTIKGPGTVNFPSSKATPEALNVGAGETIALTAATAWELSLVKLDSTADVVTILSGQGHLALIDRTEQANKVLTPGEPITLCVRGDCKCPPDSEGKIPPTIPALATIDIGITGGVSGAFGWAHGEKIDDFCDPKKPKEPMGKIPNGLGGGGGGGGEPPSGKATSDPHIVTFDGRWYDVQAVGEFVLSRSTVDDFSVQMRMGTLGALRTISVGTSMATKVGADRVTVSVDPASASPVPVLRVNGTVAAQDFVGLAAGSVRAVFNEYGTGYVIEFADGSRVGVTPLVRQGLNVWVLPAPARQGKLSGLLGDGDGNKDNDPVLRSTSTVLRDKPSYDELYTQFANSWRVTQAESLFDYATGETTATFSNPAFPDRDKPAADAASLATGEASCTAGGVTDANLLRNCAFDLAVTGNPRFLRSYTPQQRRLDIVAEVAKLSGTGTVTTTPSTGRTKSVVLEGRVTDATADAFASFEGFKGDVVYLDPSDCAKPKFMTILDPDGKQVGGIAPQCGARLVFPADGTYRLSLNPFHDFAGTYRVSIVAVRPDRVTTIKPGDTLVGTLANRAEHDVFLLEMKAPGSITIGGDGCAAEFDVVLYFGDAETVSAGTACRFGKVTLPKAGTYRIVINAFDAATGSYRIPTA
ncbi:MAG: VWD domain-containing protein [Acidimicrobiales bacterium]